MTLKTSSKFILCARALVAFAMLLGALQLAGTPASAEGDMTAYNDQVVRLYRTTLGRGPDEGGLAYWADRLWRGESVQSVAAGFLASSEATTKTSGDPIVDAYVGALNRMPEPAGHEYWLTKPVPMAIVAISDSPEHVRITGTTDPPAPRPAPVSASVAAAPAGWVDSGNGVMMPPVLLRIRQCESKNNYQAANRWSSARGAYQFLKSSWRLYGHADRYGVAEAHLATNAQQDEAAVLTWQRSGTSPWNASGYCWR